jgi:hypothetical protein
MAPITPIGPISHANFDGLWCILHTQRILSVRMFDFALGSTMSGKQHEPSVGETHSLEAKMSFLTIRPRWKTVGPEYALKPFSCAEPGGF